MRKIFKLAAIVGFASALPISAAVADTSLNDEAAAVAAPQHFPPIVFQPGEPASLASPQIAAYQPGFLFQRRVAPAAVDEEPGQSPNETAAEEAMTPGY